MITLTLNYATNRNLIGDDLAPSAFGQDIEKNSTENLNFGRVLVNIDQDTITHYLSSTRAGRVGDGEGLCDYLTKQLRESHNISPYKHHKLDENLSLNHQHKSAISTYYEITSKLDIEQDVVVYIHGFNVDWYEAVGAAMALELSLNAQKGELLDSRHVHVLLFTWPSNGFMMSNNAYGDDRYDAKASATAITEGFKTLQTFIARQHNNSEQTTHRKQNLHLLCHSMGNFVLQHALQRLIETEATEALPKIFNHIFMCAPDIDHDVFEETKPLHRLDEICDHVTIYFNTGDLAMYISDYTKGNPPRLGHKGVKKTECLPSKVHQVDCSPIVGGITEHSYYLWATVNLDIKQSIDNVRVHAPTRKRISLNNLNDWQIF